MQSLLYLELWIYDLDYIVIWGVKDEKRVNQNNEFNPIVDNNNGIFGFSRGENYSTRGYTFRQMP